MSSKVPIWRPKVLGLLFATLLLGILFLLIETGLRRKWFEFPGPFEAIPWMALGESFVTASVLGLTYEWLIRRESKTELEKTVNEALTTARNDLLDALTVDSLTSPGAIARLSLSELRAASISVLGAQLGDNDLANELLDALIGTEAGSPPRQVFSRGLTTHVQFLPQKNGGEGAGTYMDVRVALSMRRRLEHPHYTFVVADNRQTLLDRVGDGTHYDYVWFTGLATEYPAANTDSFVVHSCRVNEEELATTDTGQEAPRVLRYVSDSLIPLVGEEVRISYSFTVKVSRLSHFLYFPIPQASDGMQFDLDTGDVGISRASVWPFVLSSARPSLNYVDYPDSRQVISVVSNRWVMPGGGLAISWRLEEEAAPSFLRAVGERPKRMR